jgi:hypothetical protein
MVMNEEAIISVSDTHTIVTEGDTIVVKEASGEMEFPMRLPSPDPQPTDQRGESPILPEEEETKARTQNADTKPKSWLESQDAKDFEPFLVTELKRIKPPSACVGSHNEAERALGQYKRLNGHVSRALQSDYDGVLNIGSIDRLRQLLEQNIEAIDRMLEAQKDMKKRRRQVRRRASDESICPSCSAPLWEDGENMVCLACGQDGLKKEAGTPHFEGLQYQISAFERALVGTLINATISGGRNLEELFKKLDKKYKLNPREKLAVQQILSDMGYPVFKDRARIDEDEDPTDPDEPREWQTQYHA